MADLPQKISIDKINWNERLPKWATEKTLEEVNKNLTRIANKLVKDKQVNSQQAQQGLNNLSKSTYDQIQASKKKTQEELKDQKTLGETYKDVEGHFKNVGVSTHSLNLKLDTMSVITSGITGIFKSFSSVSGILSIGMLGAVLAVDKLINELALLTSSTLQLYDTGLTFQNGLGELRVAAASTVMSVEQFAGLMIKNSALFKAMGKDSATTFGNIVTDVRKLSEQYLYYGLTIDQLAGYTASYLSLLRSQGMVTRLTQQEQTQAANDYIRNLTLYSQILGKSREEIDKDVHHFATAGDVIGTFANNAKGLEMFNNRIAQLSGAFGESAGVVEDFFRESTTSPLGRVNDMSRTLQIAGSGFGQQLFSLENDIKDGRITEAQASAKMNDILNNFKNLDNQTLDNLRVMATTANPLQETAKSILSLYGQIQGADLSGIFNRPNPFTVAMIKLAQMILQVQAIWDNVFANFIISNEKTLTKIIDGLNILGSWLSIKLKEFLEYMATVLDSKSWSQAFGKIFTDIKSLFSSIGTSIATAFMNGIDAVLYRKTHGLLGSSPEQITQNNVVDSIKDPKDRKQVEDYLGITSRMANPFSGSMDTDEDKKRIANILAKNNINPSVLNLPPVPTALVNPIMPGANTLSLSKDNSEGFDPTLKDNISDLLSALIDGNKSIYQLLQQNNDLQKQGVDHLDDIKDNTAKKSGNYVH